MALSWPLQRTAATGFGGDRTALGESHFDVRPGQLLDAVQNCDRMRSRAVVIALQHGYRFAIRPDDGDAFDFGAVERQDAVVLQQHQ